MDKKRIIKVPTFKSGNFVFSYNYDHTKLNIEIYGLKILYEAVTSIPMLPEWSTNLREEIIRKSIFGTAALEGNPLSEEDVGKIVGETDRKKATQRAEQEIINLKDAYNKIRKQKSITQPVKLDESLIKQVHKLITKKIEYKANVPGTYRSHRVSVGDRDHGGVYTPPKCLPDIEKLMKEFCKWINSESLMALNPMVRAALAHYHLGLIHPFGDGNGRTARVIEAFLLRLSGIKLVPTMLSNYYYRQIDDYFWAFSQSRKNSNYDITPFISFVLNGAKNSLEEIQKGVISSLERLILRDYNAFLRNTKAITQREHDLINIILHQNPYSEITLQALMNTAPYNTLYRGASERTIYRNLQKLCDNKLLFQENGKYKLNFAFFK